MEVELISIEVRYEQDAVLARQRARDVARAVGCDGQDQIRVATSVSEVIRLLMKAGGQTTVSFFLDAAPESTLVVRAEGALSAPERADEEVQGEDFSSARRIVDRLSIDRAGDGVVVCLKKRLPRNAVRDVRQIRDSLRDIPARDSYQEFQRQNQELLQALADLRRSQNELGEVNRELAETNRGVVALYAELEETTASLRRSAEEKTRFYSGVTHELRTPVNSILSLSRMLLERLDGDLEAEQERQVSLIRKSAENLSEWIDDLLDLAKADAGRMTVHVTEFAAQEMLGAVRALVRPLNTRPDVDLVFDDASTVPPLFTDEGKLTQILRNFVVNALKFTDSGEVRVHAAVLMEAADMVRFSVRDTGIGIAEQDLDRVFQEFVQIDNAQQFRFKGTGLGLPLSQRLARLLGGRITVESRLGRGSEFAVVIPRTLASPDIAVGKIVEPEARH